MLNISPILKYTQKFNNTLAGVVGLRYNRSPNFV